MVTSIIRRYPTHTCIHFQCIRSPSTTLRALNLFAVLVDLWLSPKLLMKSIVKPLHQFHHYTKKPICTHLQYIFCKPQVSYLSTRLQHPYPCKYSFGEDQKSWLCFILKKWESKPITTPLELKIKEAPCSQIQPIRVLDQFIFTLSHSKAQVQGGAFYPCTLYVSLLYKKKSKKKRKEKERVHCRVLYIQSEVLGLQPLLVFTQLDFLPFHPNP